MYSLLYIWTISFTTGGLQRDSGQSRFGTTGSRRAGITQHSVAFREHLEAFSEHSHSEHSWQKHGVHGAIVVHANAAHES